VIYLAELISVLVPEEIEKLAILEADLAPKEAEILAILKKDMADSSISNILNISNLTESHVYKIVSILTQKILDFLEPNGMIDQLYFLSRKDVSPLFKHELLKHKKNIINQPIKEQLRFYYVGFELLQRGSYIHRDEKLIHEFAENLLKIGDDFQLKPYVKIRMLRSLFLYQYSLNQLDKMAEIYEEIISLMKGLDEEQHTLALFHAYQMLFLYENYTGTKKNIEKHLIKALEYYEKENYFLGPEDKVQVLLKIAEAYLVTLRFQESFAIYQEVLQKYPSAFRYDLYHQSKFLTLCIIFEEHQLAENILNQSFTLYLKSHNESRVTMTALSFIKFSIAIQDFQTAKKYLLLAKKNNRKSFFLHYEAEIRILEVIISYFTEDFEFVLSLLKKDIKYLQRNGFTMENSVYYKYLYLLQFWIKMNEPSSKKTNWSQACLQILEEFEHNFMGVFAYFLSRIIQQPIQKERCA